MHVKIIRKFASQYWILFYPYLLHGKLYLYGPNAFITLHTASPASYHPCWLCQWWVWRTVQQWHWHWWISAGKEHCSVPQIWPGALCALSWCVHWVSAEFPTAVPGCTSRTAGLAGLEREKPDCYKWLLVSTSSQLNKSSRFLLKGFSRAQVKCRISCKVSEIAFLRTKH